MSHGMDTRMKRGTPGTRQAKAAPRGAIIMGAYLFGMAAVGMAAYGLRDRVSDTPIPVDHAGITMPVPRVAPDDPGAILPGAIGARPEGGAAAPRLAALSPAETRIGKDLVSPLSRVFLGKPSAVPPTRPRRDATGQAPASGQGPADIADRAGVLRASLRPRQRPETLRIAPAPEAARLASLSPLPAPASSPKAPAALPAAPRIAAPSANCPARLARAIPRRGGNASGAQAVMAGLSGLDGVMRDRELAREILAGNVPGFLRNLVPVTVNGQVPDGSPVSVTLCVTPDYLALGSDRDFVRVPLGLRAATRIGDAFNMLLPTPRMVDMIYRAAKLKVSPQPMTPGAQMTSTAYVLRHDQTIRAQRERAGAAIGTLIAGQKKDVVLTSRLASHIGRVAIYGWHRGNGRPIQPLSTVHGAGYADYSHGVRLVSRTAFLNGKPVDLRDLLADPRYAGLLSTEGPIGGPALRMAALAAN